MTTITECALFQPITSLVSSLMFVKSEHVTSLCALPSTSLAENKLISISHQADGDLSCCSKQFSTDDDLFPMEADFCVNLDRLFSTSTSNCGMEVLSILIEHSLL